jgi:hypothetical protein
VLTGHPIMLNPDLFVGPPIDRGVRPPPASQATLGQFIEHSVQRPRTIDNSMLGMTALPMDACGISMPRGVLTWHTSLMLWCHIPDKQLPTHAHDSFFTGHTPLGQA